MNKEELQEEAGKILSELGARDVKFSDEASDKIVASFNWENVVSFKPSLSGWTYSGIQLDPTKEREYRIEFSKEPSEMSS